MACINPNSPEFKEILSKVNNPLLAEIEMDKGIVPITQEIPGNTNNTFPSRVIPDFSENNKDTYYQKVTDTVSPFEQMSKTDQVAFEKTVRDLAARMSDRIGIPYKIINNTNEKYKGKLSNGIAYINLAYCDMSTAIHEILGHPIIKSIKNTNLKLYQNLLKELESGKGEEILNRVKRDYVRKFSTFNYESLQQEEKENIYYNWYYNWITSFENEDENEDGDGGWYPSNAEKEAAFNKYIEDKSFSGEYTLEEQQEEAIVELLGLMTAEKLDKVKDKNLISLLKQLLKEMKQFIRALLSQREVEIDKLPTSMTINDLSDLLAYSNNKLILPGYEVEYTTPDDIKFKTYQEASNHISELTKSIKDVDLNSITLEDVDLSKIDYFEHSYIEEHDGKIHTVVFKKENNVWFSKVDYDNKFDKVEESHVLTLYREITGTGLIYNFLERNMKYEKAKHIIEEWKKVNNIQYNPEEVYSRGQEFVSVLGAFSKFDVNLMLQNLLSHIEDNQKAGGKFTVSAFTKPVDERFKHLEQNGGKIRFKIYPQSEDILWAANFDAKSGSVWDANEKMEKRSKAELAGVSYLKYPSYENLDIIKPNLAEIIDDIDYSHNEIAIALTYNNFELEYDDDIPYQTKKIIDSVNSILKGKRGGNIVKPLIEKNTNNSEIFQEISEISKLKHRSVFFDEDLDDYIDTYTIEHENRLQTLKNLKIEGITPIQTKYNLTESISKTKDRLYSIFADKGKFAEQDNNVLNYTSQALINIKIVALKEAAKKYPRSLIRSEVKKIEDTTSSYEDYEDDIFQKLPSVSPFEEFQKSLDKPDTNPVLTGNLKPDIILPIGTSGSGKSTWIKSVNTNSQFVVISPDDMRVEFTGDMNNKSKDDEIYQAVTDRAIQAVKEGKQVIVDTTNLKKERRRPFIDAVKKALPDSIIQYKLLPLNPELAKQRIKADIEAGVNRANVPDSTIDKHAKSYNDMLEDIKSEDISNYDYKEEQAKKFNELQEKLQDETFLEAVKSVFDNSSKLQQLAYETFLPDEDTSMKLSSKEEALSLYTDYVAKIALGIIKNPSSGEYNDSSKVTDILHHGVTRGEVKDFDKFSDINQSSGTWGKGYYFAPTSNKFFVNAPIEKYVIVNSKKVITEKEHKTLFEEYKKRGFQGTVGLADTDNMFKEVREKYDTIDARERELIVFNPDQIHILDSKQDIEGFEKYIFNKSRQKPIVETKNTVDNLPLNTIQPEEIEDIVYHGTDAKFDKFDKNFIKKEGVFNQQTNIKEGVPELFDSNPELANAVYEALGLKSKLSDIKPKVSITNYRNVTKQDKQNAVNGDIEAQKKWMIEEISEFYEAVDGFNNNTMSIDDVGEEVLGLFRTAQQFPEVKDFINPYIEDVQIALDNINKKEQYDKFKSKKTAKAQAEDMTFDNLFDVVNSFPNSKKQQALQLYSQYLSNFVNTNFDSIISELQSKKLLEKKCS